jgi:hypothetical protein
MLIDLLTSTVLVVSQQLDGTLDEYGNDVPSETVISTVGFMERGRKMGMTEAEREGWIEESAMMLILAAGTPVHAEDVVFVDGVSYSVSGEPWNVMNPRLGAVDHMELTVIRTVGALEVGS